MLLEIAGIDTAGILAASYAPLTHRAPVPTPTSQPGQETIPPMTTPHSHLVSIDRHPVPIESSRYATGAVAALGEASSISIGTACPEQDASLPGPSSEVRNLVAQTIRRCKANIVPQGGHEGDSPAAVQSPVAGPPMLHRGPKPELHSKSPPVMQVVPAGFRRGVWGP